MSETSDDDAVRHGVPGFVEAYNRILMLVERTGLEPGDLLPGEVALAGELSVDRPVVQEALLLLEEDGLLARGRDRRWVVAVRSAERLGFADGFHHLLGGEVVPQRRLHAQVEQPSAFSAEMLGTDGPYLVWETVFALDAVLLAATLEFLRLDSVPAGIDLDLPAEEHDVLAHPTLLDAIGPARRARLTPQLWRVAPVSRATERLSWMELPLHAIPAVLTLVLADDERPVYLAKNLFDLGTFNLTVDLLDRPADRPS